jgi:hypothetical protein
MPTEETPVVAAPAADAPVADTSAEWDGTDWSALDAQPWWKQVPESARGHITKAHEERTTHKSRNDFLDRLLGEDDDKVRSDLVAAQAERDALKAERDTLAESLRGIEARTAEEHQDREFTRLSAKFADIFADFEPDPKGDGVLPKGAYHRFVTLLNKGFEEDEAAVMARAVMTKKEPAAEVAPAAPAAPAGPPKTREVKIPPAIAQANKGGNNPSATVNAKQVGEDLAQAAERLRKQYAAEEEAAAR